MPIDTSSYYPETGNEENSLNSRNVGLFGVPENNPGLPPELPPSNREEVKNSKDSRPEEWEKVVSGFSHLLSWVLVPFLMPVYGLIFAFGLSVLDLVPMGMRVRFTLITAGINCVIPSLLVMLLKFLGLVDDLGLNGRKERLIPYIITILCMGATAWFMAMKGAPLWLSMFFAGGAAAGIINLIVNFRWKISAHAAGIAGIIALLIRMEREAPVEPALFTWLIITIGMAGLLGSARVWLGRHTVWQVLAGYVVGFCSVFFLMGV